MNRIILVTPWAWSTPHPTNDHVRDIVGGLDAATNGGINIVVVGPSLKPADLLATRRALRKLTRGDAHAEVLSDARIVHDINGVHVPVLTVGVPLAFGNASVMLRANMRAVFERLGADALLVCDPVESFSRAALALWPGLSVGFQHEPSHSGLVAITHAARERALERVDLLYAPAAHVAGDVARALDVPLDSIHIASDVAHAHTKIAREAQAATPAVGAVVLRGDEDESLAKAFMKELGACAREELLVPPTTFLSRWHAAHLPSIPRTLRGTVHHMQHANRDELTALCRDARVVIALGDVEGRAIREADAAGAAIVPVRTIDGARTAARTLVRDVDSLIGAALPVDGSAPAFSSNRELAQALLVGMESLQAQRRPDVQVAKRAPATCTIDLHMHTNHSWDCATEPRALLEAARAAGLTAIAVTDHNEVSGALECAELADEYGLQVIVGEEVMTTQGEVIGLFLSERIPKGLTWEETLLRIRQQDGLVYVPHPFDRMHTIPDVHTLRASVPEIDILETANGRLAFEQYNKDAQRFARKYNLLEGAGSDAHVVQSLGSSYLSMPAWDDPESFIAAVRQATIVRDPKNYLYVQGLKFVKTRTGKTGQAPAHDTDE